LTPAWSQDPHQFLKKYCLVPINCSKPPTAVDCGLNEPNRGAPGQPVCVGGCVIAVRDPLEFQALDDLVRILNIPDYQLVLATRDTILSAINLQYDLSRDSAQQLVQDMEEDGTTIISEIEETADLLDDTSEAPIIKLVNPSSPSPSRPGRDIHSNLPNQFHRATGGRHLYDLPPHQMIHAPDLPGEGHGQDEHRRSACPRTAV
jgi:general secretion pathway protein E